MESHIKSNQGLAAASGAKLGTASSFAATQAAWRFCAHEETTVGLWRSRYWRRVVMV